MGAECAGAGRRLSGLASENPTGQEKESRDGRWAIAPRWPRAPALTVCSGLAWPGSAGGTGSGGEGMSLRKKVRLPSGPMQAHAHTHVYPSTCAHSYTHAHSHDSHALVCTLGCIHSRSYTLHAPLMHSRTHTHTAHAQAQSQVHTPVHAYAKVYTHSALQRVVPGGGRVRARRSRCSAQAGRSSGRGAGLAAGQLSRSARLGLCGNTFALVHLASALCVFKGFVWLFVVVSFLDAKGL